MSSPTSRSLEYLRRSGWPFVRVVERWNPHAKVRQDLFGFIDVLAMNGNTLLAVQATTASNASARRAKINAAPEAMTWLHGGPARTLQVHGWHKVKNRWQLKVWQAHVAAELSIGSLYGMKAGEPQIAWQEVEP